ncbi:MAG: hypothetical protein AB1631_28830 [Acidobacteriota bacterium]
MTKRKFASLILMLYCAVTALGLPAAKGAKEVYTGSVVDTSGFRRTGTAFITITIDQYTTDDEMRQLEEAYSSDKQSGLLKAMRKMKKGTVQITGSLGYRIHAARQITTKDGSALLVAFERPISWLEARSASSSLDYPFAVIEIEFDEKGKGEGTLHAAAKIKISEANEVKVEGYEFNPARLINVRKRK